MSMESLTSFVRDCRKSKQAREAVLFSAHLKANHDESQIAIIFGANVEVFLADVFKRSCRCVRKLA